MLSSAPRLLRASIEYWLLLLLLAAGLVYANGAAYRARCVAVGGQVVAQLDAPPYQLTRPVFRYEVAGEWLESVPPNVQYATGARAPLLVLRGQPHEIRVYDATYWVSFGFDTFPIFLFGSLVYAGLLVHAARLRRRLQVLALASARLAGA